GAGDAIGFAGAAAGAAAAGEGAGGGSAGVVAGEVFDAGEAGSPLDDVLTTQPCVAVPRTRRVATRKNCFMGALRCESHALDVAPATCLQPGQRPIKPVSRP